MNFHCEMSESGDYVRVRMGHPVTIESVRAFVAEATRLGAEARAAADVFWYFREELPRIPRLRWARVAVLTDPTDLSHSFVETTSANAGYALHCFADEQLAIDWLRTPR